ncbi:MAG: hypothetical protein AAB407_03605 [Patescibacteria group bacterium]
MKTVARVDTTQPSDSCAAEFLRDCERKRGPIDYYPQGTQTMILGTEQYCYLFLRCAEFLVIRPVRFIERQFMKFAG